MKHLLLDIKIDVVRIVITVDPLGSGRFVAYQAILLLQFAHTTIQITAAVLVAFYW